MNTYLSPGGPAGQITHGRSGSDSSCTSKPSCPATPGEPGSPGDPSGPGSPGGPGGPMLHDNVKQPEDERCEDFYTEENVLLTGAVWNMPTFFLEQVVFQTFKKKTLEDSGNVTLRLPQLWFISDTSSAEELSTPVLFRLLHLRFFIPSSFSLMTSSY